MGVLYPDNQNRANRVQQLASDIARLQTQVREAVVDAKLQDERAIVILDKIAKQRGFKTLDEHIKDIEGKLTPEEKKKYEDMKRVFEKKDHDLDIAMKAGSGLFSLGFAVGLAGASIASLLQRFMVIVALRAIGIGLLKAITGQWTNGINMIKSAGTLIYDVMKGQGLAGKVAKGFRALKIAGKVIAVLGVALDAILLIYEAVDGVKQRSEFQEAIKELCVRRMTTKKIQQYTRVTLTFSSDAKAIADFAESIVSSGIHAKQEMVDAAVANKIKELEQKITKDIEGVTDKSIYESLELQDIESQVAWTDEDPSLDWMIKKIEEDAKEEAD